MEIFLKKGQMLALDAHILPQFAIAMKGKRYVLTCSTSTGMHNTQLLNQLLESKGICASSTISVVSKPPFY
jgi:hypothetical protein